ncbi:MAG: shikimate dehydrogenase [Proteobacteria bacterium]|nr:shikimate dehydrogenase [Pseudomonadota bacterium]
MPVAVDTRQSFLVGLIGAGIQRSLTPAMHQHEGAAQGFAYAYKLIDLQQMGLTAEALPQLLDKAEREGFCGLNITHPCKQLVIPLLHELSDDARSLGAVNTVLFRDGRRVGHNTDWSGFTAAFARGLAGAQLDRVVQLGAGGAGAAVAYAALKMGAAQLALFDTDGGRAAALAASLAALFGAGRVTAGDDLPAAMAKADGLIHATPTGMAAYPGLPLPAGLLRPSHWVAEIVYFPLETALLRAARDTGCRTLDGGGMAVFQAVDAFRLFTELEPDAARMLRDFNSLVGAGTA